MQGKVLAMPPAAEPPFAAPAAPHSVGEEANSSAGKCCIGAEVCSCPTATCEHRRNVQRLKLIPLGTQSFLCVSIYGATEHSQAQADRPLSCHVQQVAPVPRRAGEHGCASKTPPPKFSRKCFHLVNNILLICMRVKLLC